ncbi:AMP-binding protein [Balneolaceae bacterium ANBcel3]|nr:AMP-binding protein [Balneolaceae bacterium ANBcel3]
MKYSHPLVATNAIDSIQDMLLQSVKEYGKRRAVTDFSDTPIRELSFQELLSHVQAFGTALQKIGLKERSHIAIIGENRVQWAIAYLATQCYNYVAVPVDRNLSKTEILNIIHESDARAVICSASSSTHFDPSNKSLRKVKHYIHMDLPKKEGAFESMKALIDDVPPEKLSPMPAIDPEEMSIIVYTSGSLGRAKGVMLSQKNIATDLMGMVQMVRLYPEDRFLSVLPIHHTYECTCGFLCPLYKGASVWFARSLKTVLEDLQASKATIMLGVPLLYEKMYKNIQKGIRERTLTRVMVPVLKSAGGILTSAGWKDAKKKLFGSLHQKFGGHIRIFIAGGAAPDPKIAEGLRKMGFSFIQGYGLTETAPIVALNRLVAFKDEAAGLPIPGVKIEILDPDENGVGEILVKGDNVMLGYYKNEEATKDSFTRDGWYRTGDLGFVDKEGFLHISGRKKNVIIAANGKNVYPEELEDLLNRSPYILESMVYGQPDRNYNEQIALQVVVDGEALIALAEKKNTDITPEWIERTIKKEVDQVNKQVASFKRIQKIIIREEEFAKTTTQKIKRYMVGKDPTPINPGEL